MSTFQSLQNQRDQIVEQIGQLGPMRKGSITSQCFNSTRKDGSPVQRGPYPLYTCKRNGRTHSRRIASPQVPDYQAQIEHYRQFESLLAQLVEVSEQMADLALIDPEAEGKKNSTKRSKPSVRAKRRG